MAGYIRFVDAATIGAATATAWWVGVRLGAWPEQTSSAQMLFSLATAVAFLFLGSRMRTYQPWRTEQIRQELTALCEIALYAAGLGCVISEMLAGGLPGPVYAITAGAGIVSLLVLRLTLRGLVRHLRSAGRDRRVWLIIGWNSRTANLAAQILSNPHFGIHIDEVVDLAGKSGQISIVEAAADANCVPPVRPRVVDGVEAVRDILASRIIDEVVVTLPFRSYYDEVQQILDMCCEAGVPVKLPPCGFDRPGYRTEVVHVGRTPVVTHFTGPASHPHLALKRVIDVVGAAFGLLLFLPLMAAIALSIKLSSRGPVFFFQARVGLRGRQFRMVKFRSMSVDAPQRQQQLAQLNETDGVAFKIKDDPRITPVGRVLRRFHADELPQLWNVLVGDMSLVGPRPLPPAEAHGNEWWQRRRLSVPPGVTCYWQVQGDHKMPFRQWAKLDLAYIDSWSVWVDLKIIMSTFATVVRGKGW